MGGLRNYGWMGGGENWGKGRNYGWMGGGQIFEDDEFSVSKFRFLPQISGKGIL